ncbi:TPA: hypothetical protein HA361_05840 [Candidatus Woesearchaeota archaeon]|nr:hypothetical protein [Candidatus Woesearchaeota archaeon]HII69165.1 hypothetical protein [Candidatus Woesearchaeota archaeon]
MAEIRKKSDKTKKKRWIPILTPASFRKQVIGDTLVSEGQDITGKPVKVNLNTLITESRSKNVSLTFTITHLEGSNAQTTITGYEVQSSSFRRFVRKGKARIDDSFTVISKDNKVVRVKPFLLVANTIPNRTTTDLRAKAAEVIIERLKKESYEQFILSLIRQDIQKELKSALKKIFPARVCEIRAALLEGDADEKAKLTAEKEAKMRIRKQKAASEEDAAEEESEKAQPLAKAKYSGKGAPQDADDADAPDRAYTGEGSEDFSESGGDLGDDTNTEEEPIDAEDKT